LNTRRLPPIILDALERGAGLIVPNAQRQAAVRSAWAEAQREAGLKVWSTPRITTLVQLAEERVLDAAATSNLPDPLLPPTAEWAAIRELRRGQGGSAEAQALLASARTLADWHMPRSKGALGASPEAALLATSLDALAVLAEREGRRPLRDLIETLTPARGRWIAAGFGRIQPRPESPLWRNS